VDSPRRPGVAPDAALDAPAHLLVRVWLHDRPGALGLVASRIGAVGGDIVGVEVVERGTDIAIDEFAVILPDAGLAELMVREIEQVDGASVEEIRAVGAFPDARLDALESAVVLCGARTPADLESTLVTHVQREFLADWVALVVDGDVAESVGPSPDAPMLDALVRGTAASPEVAEGNAGPEDLAVAALPELGATLLVGREGHVFRRRERAQLLALARVADQVWALLGQD
jgi:hypothetical protein